MSCVIIKFFQVYTNYIHFLLVYNLLCMQKPIYMIYQVCAVPELGLLLMKCTVHEFDFLLIILAVPKSCLLLHTPCHVYYTNI